MTTLFVPQFDHETLFPFMAPCSDECIERALTVLAEQQRIEAIVTTGIRCYLINGPGQFIARGTGWDVQSFHNTTDTLELVSAQQFSVGQCVWWLHEVCGGWNTGITVPATIIKLNAKTIKIAAMLTTGDSKEVSVKREHLRPRRECEVMQ